MAVVAPIPSASVSTAATVKPGERRSVRTVVPDVLGYADPSHRILLHKWISLLLQRAETYLPGTDPGSDEKAVGRPRVRREALDDFGCAGCTENEERIARALQRPDEGSESLLEQGVHEGSMGGPFRLSLQRLRVIPRWSTRPQDNECAFHLTNRTSGFSTRAARAGLTEPPWRRVQSSRHGIDRFNRNGPRPKRATSI